MNASPVATRRTYHVARLREQIAALRTGDPPLAPNYAAALSQRVERLAAELETRPEGDAVVQALNRLVDEVLVTYGGSLVRRAGLDGGVCALADLLLTEISPLTEPVPCIAGADDEFGPLLATIRVRFPTSVWSLPFVAHELGHQVAFRHVREDGTGITRRSTTPISAVFEHWRGQHAWSHAGELFSDIFATWTLGPAFPAALISLRLDDGRDDSPGDQHPSPSVRIAACRLVLDTLDAIDDSFGASLWSIVAKIEGRRAMPAQPAIAAPRPRQPGGAGLDAAAAEEVMTTFLAILRTDFADVRYRSTQDAITAQHVLAGEDDTPPRVPVRAMLDAAWRIRSTRKYEPEPELSTRVTSLFRTWVPALANQ